MMVGPGVLLTLVAVLGMAWAARQDGLLAFGWKPAGTAQRAPSPRPWLLLALLFFGAFLLLLAATHLPAIREFDRELVLEVHLAGDRKTDRMVRKVSELGAFKTLIYAVPLVALALSLCRRVRAIRFFFFGMVGSAGLELLFKGLVMRPRPLHPGQLESFPSGHALAATILSGTLLLLLLPACRRAWHRVLLWAGAAVWVVVISGTRVYLGRHHLTDLAGSVLLGSAWLFFCYWLVLTLSHPAPDSTPEAGEPRPA